MSAEWYYVGTFGQLGPLTMEQMRELAVDGVIARDTYVWRTGMSNWAHAEHVSELIGSLGEHALMAAPPPPPTPTAAPSMSPIAERYGIGLSSPTNSMSSPTNSMMPQPTFYDRGMYSTLPVSDRNRILAGVLQILIPGVGRMYLGYWAQGVLQLILIPVCGIGAIWSLIDGILILCGTAKVDGYGRSLPQ